MRTQNHRLLSTQIVVSATDPDVNGTLEYTLTGGADQDQFLIDQSSGELTFVSSPDHEQQSRYEIEVTVTDNEGLAATQTILINVQGSSRAGGLDRSR